MRMAGLSSSAALTEENFGLVRPVRLIARACGFLQDQRRGMIRHKWDEMHLDVVPDQNGALLFVQRFECVIAAFGIRIRPQRVQLGRAARRIEHQHRVHAAHRRQQIRPVVFAVDRPVRPFQAAHRGVGIDQHQQGVGGLPRRQQIFGMPAVQDVETAVGHGQTQTFFL